MSNQNRAPQQPAPSPQNSNQPQPKRLSPGEWARVVLGVEAPFGFDGLPTVIG